MSINECTFPDLLKYVEMAALFKKLDRLCKENYRPVSILTALSKVFEKIYCRQLASYFDRIFSKYLSGLDNDLGISVLHILFWKWFLCVKLSPKAKMFSGLPQISTSLTLDIAWLDILLEKIV